MERVARPGGKAWARIRWTVLQRDRSTCQYCGQRAPDVVLHVDHRVALVDGGSNDLDNLVTACAACNAGKEAARARTAGAARRLARAQANAATAQRIVAALSDGPLTLDELRARLDLRLLTLIRAINSAPDLIVPTLDSHGQHTWGLAITSSTISPPGR